jgi:hypothetical protein
MAYDATKPANNSNPVAADIRENFRALKEDGISAIAGGTLSQVLATPTEINTVADGATAKNSHEHSGAAWIDGKGRSVLYSEIVTRQVVSGTWATLAEIRVYVPANATKLYGSVKLYRGAQAGTAYVRLSLGGQTSGNASNATQTHTWDEFATPLDASALAEGWATLSIQGYHSAGAYSCNIAGITIIWGI